MISKLTISKETFENLSLLYSDSKNDLDWNLIFTLPAWLKVWWQIFGAKAELDLMSVRQDGYILGIAPVQIREGVASIIGSVDVCDYQDFITAPGKEREFYEVVFDNLSKRKVEVLHLETIRFDSNIVKILIPLARERGFKIDYRQTDVSFDLPLHSKWDEFLKSLDGQQRHELRRKIRNLDTSLSTNYRVISKKEELLLATEDFLKLFPEARNDKAEFMTPKMRAYFYSIAKATAEMGILNYGVLELSDRPIAMVMYFDYLNNYYLYNSAYDPAYRSLSVGLISKAYCIRDGIEKGKKRFDFLKGAEVYKSHLGGEEIPLFRCDIFLV